tara:strand:- start:830 stop:1204 length:375 start_codon:yes stop_codon:yes gene_type:complete
MAKVKYLYFRSVTAVGDDDSSADSLIVPAANFKGAHPTDDDSIQLTFKSLYNEFTDGDNEVVVSDYVKLTTGTNKAKEAVQALAKEIANPYGDSMIVVADDVAGKYISSDVTACETITVATILS